MTVRSGLTSEPAVAGPVRRSVGSFLLVANYAPEVGFAWWLMENFWVHAATVGKRLGLEPLVAYPTEGVVPASLRDAGIATVILPFPGRGIGGLWRSLRLIRKHRVRAAYLTDRPFTSLKYLCLRMAGIRHIVNHDHVPGDRPPVRGLRRLAKTILRRLPWVNGDLQIAVSPLIRDRAVGSARIPRGKTAVVQNGIEPIECPEDRDYARRELGLPDRSLICINVGRAHANKRIDFVIEVARHCVEGLCVDDLYFVHCGDGPELDRLRTLAAERGLTARFVFAGRRSDVKELLCSSDLALHAARGEAFSLAILEYMGAGLPVLVPDIPTVRQAVRHGETGLVYRDLDVAEAGRLVAELCMDPARRSRLGSAAAAEVRMNYSLEAMNETFRRVVAGVLEA
jgi:glycosyltransferase involved in cell wall biosynthesis